MTPPGRLQLEDGRDRFVALNTLKVRPGPFTFILGCVR